MLSIDIERSTSLTPDSGSFKCPVTFLSLSSPPAKPSEPVDPTVKDHLKKIIQPSLVELTSSDQDPSSEQAQLNKEK